jgi:hypothetical protein
VGIGALVLWLIGFASMTVLGIGAAQQFAEVETSKYTFPIAPTKCDTLFLKVKGEPDFGYEHKRWGKHMRVRMNKRDIISSDSANINFGFPQLDIVRGESENFEVIIYGESRGSDRKEALHLARNIIYSITQSDSILEFSPYYSIPKDVKWRAQELHVEVRVPKGKMVFLHKSMKHIIYDVDNDTDTWDGDMVNRRWIMGDEQLRCVDCNGLDEENQNEDEVHIDKNVKVDITGNDVNIAVDDVKKPEKPKAPKKPAEPAAQGNTDSIK